MNSTCQDWLSYNVSTRIYVVLQGTDGPWLVSLSLGGRWGFDTETEVMRFVMHIES